MHFTINPFLSKVFSKTFLLFQVAEIYNFGQDDLMTEDIDILSCHSEIFVWVGQQVDLKTKVHALKIGEVCFITVHHQEIESLIKNFKPSFTLMSAIMSFTPKFSGHVFLFQFFLILDRNF